MVSRDIKQGTSLTMVSRFTYGTDLLLRPVLSPVLAKGKRPMLQSRGEDKSQHRAPKGYTARV